MTWQYSDTASMPDPADPVLRPSRTPAAQGEETPAGLLRRADSLLDEMMLAGVDLAGGVLAPAAIPTPQLSPTALTNGADHEGAHSEPVPQRTERLISAADRYAPTTAATLPETMVGRLAPAVPAAAPPVVPPPLPAIALPSAQPPAARVDLEPRVPEAPWAHPSNGGEAGAPAYARNPNVRSQSSLASSMMTVGTRGALRSNLLPRSGDANAEGIQQEIRDLMAEVTATLPAGNEAYERSRHLLNKAQAILQSDPLRTAEAEYYLQQVRRIVERAHQRNAWSAVYRQRLNLYLLGWVALAALVLVASVLYAGALVTWATAQANSDLGTGLASYLPMALWTLAAGALGAAVMELVAMRRYAGRPYGLFDRKYGLRGLLMPLLGLGLGLVIVAIWGALLWALGIDPAERLWVGVIPTVLAFFAGLTQRWFYGVR